MMYNKEDFEGINGLGFIAHHGIRVEMLDVNKFRVFGFYKSDCVDVDLETKTITARYNEVTKIEEWSDFVDTLIDLNKEWQARSAPRSEYWEKMHPDWVDIEEKYNRNKK